jgi:hypothetical protein
MERNNIMTRFLGAVVAVAFLAGTGCYATVQGPPAHPSSARHYNGDVPGNQDRNGMDRDRDDQHGNQDREHAKSNYGGDKDHD